ncbi:hypothetical protein ACIBG8_14760 [Nonomuraea sp. NPDC050556]|uniref:hypothetical protein n=1 Tax=Nonomuraea sp. NPDC050556 TaxID=3364369 RepID=UPI00379B1329
MTSQDARYFIIRDLAHRQAVRGGDDHDRRAYHDDPAKRDNALWRFEEADPGFYYIVDRKHVAALWAGTEMERVCHEKAYHGKHEAQWEVLPTPDAGVYWLRNRKTGDDLVAGDQHDHKVYRQKAHDRRNGQWTIELTNPDATMKGGPRNVIVDEQVVGPVTFTERPADDLEIPPLLVVDNLRVTNATTLDQDISLQHTITDTVTTTVTTTHTASVRCMSALTIELGNPKVAGVSIKTQTSAKYAFTSARSMAQEVSNILTVTIPVKALKRSEAVVSTLLRRKVVKVDFEAGVRRVLADGSVRLDTVKGQWQGVEYITAEVDVTDRPLGSTTLPTSRLGRWTAIPRFGDGSAPRDLAVGGDGMVWIASDGNQVRRWNPATKTYDTQIEVHAVRITADDRGAAWLIDSDSVVRRIEPPRGSEHAQLVTVSPRLREAVDLAAGKGGVIWALAGEHPVGGGDTPLLRWTGPAWEPVPGIKGTAVAAGTDGLPWVVTAQGRLFRHEPPSTWTEVQQSAKDVARSAETWVVTPLSPAGDSAVMVFDGTAWQTAPGAGAARLAVSPDGVPWRISGEEVSYLATEPS